MTNPIQKLNNLVPKELNSKSTPQHIINVTYKNNLGNKMLNFIQQLGFNIMRRRKGGWMCNPKVTWKIKSPVSLNCSDNFTLYGALGNSLFLRIANIYARNIQVHKNYLYMRSQGKIAKRPMIAS
jgi:hypothetical protein